MIEEAKREGGKWLHPRQVLRELEKAMPAHVMVSTDIGNINSVANSYLRFEEPRSMFAAMSFGNCGYAFPTIVGAKVAAPHRPAISYAGDGAWAMSMGEILTCVRHDIPVTAVVFHTRQWGAEKKNQVDFYNRRLLPASSRARASRVSRRRWAPRASSSTGSRTWPVAEEGGRPR